MSHSIRVHVIVVGVLIGCASQASAETRVSQLLEVIAESKTIAVVKFAGFSGKGSRRRPRLDVLHVLKGRLHTGEQEVVYESQRYAWPETGQFVAFLDNDGTWR